MNDTNRSLARDADEDDLRHMAAAIMRYTRRMQHRAIEVRDQDRVRLDMLIAEAAQMRAELERMNAPSASVGVETAVHLSTAGWVSPEVAVAVGAELRAKSDAIEKAHAALGNGTVYGAIEAQRILETVR